MALLAGSTSVYMSIKCVLVITSLLEKDRPDWRCAFEKPGYTAGEGVRHDLSPRDALNAT